MIGTVFKKRPDAQDKGKGEQWETWKVTNEYANDLYGCVRVDSTHDPLGTANPVRRIFTKSKIDKYVLDNR